MPESSAVATMRRARSVRIWRRLPMALGHAYGGGSQFFSMWVVSSTPVP
ncbi:MAG TPA: hypothetical protein VK584_12655 [Streptosporangiaceae bacterium]|nr:hypothetical protein [Streptosporangiaceae bacterium]